MPTVTYEKGEQILGESEFQPFTYGRDSFLPMIDGAYTLLCGNAERLRIGLIWWKPGAERDDEFNMPGEWGISFTDAEPESWQPVTATTVFAFNDSDCWDVDDVDFVVGTTNPISFYSNEAWAGFDPENDDYEYDQIQESYEESCAAHIRALIGDAVPTEFTLADIKNKMENSQARITSIRYHYPPQKAHPNAAPIAITARNSAGEKKRLKLVA